MDIDTILQKEEPLTDEELAFVEQQVLDLSRAFVDEVQKLCALPHVAGKGAATALQDRAASVLRSVELRSAVPRQDP